MLILSFTEVFAHEDFQKNFNIRDFNRVEGLRWIRTSTIPAARRIVGRLTAKSCGRKAPLENLTIKDREDAVMTELGSRQVSQTFRAALAVYSYADRDPRVNQEFRFTFFDRQCSTML